MAAVQAARDAGLLQRAQPEVIMLAVRWYLRYGLSHRDVEDLLVEPGVEVDHVTIQRWVQRFTLLRVDAVRSRRRSVGGRWSVDESYVVVGPREQSVVRYRSVCCLGGSWPTALFVGSVPVGGAPVVAGPAAT